MKRYLSISISIILVITALVLGGRYARARVESRPLAASGAPTMVSYQGLVTVDGTPYEGTGYFMLAVVNAVGNTTYWSNDGTSTVGDVPTNAISLTVTGGLFNVLLGDISLTNMTTLTASAFEGTERYLRVWFSDDNATFTLLSPDRRIAAVPYALQAQESVNADTLDGLHASQLGTHYQNVVVVAKSGGDYTSVQMAIDGIGDAAADNPYLVWVAPGVYSETVTMKPYVHLQGAGQETTVITSTISNSGLPVTQATLVLTSDTNLRDLTVGNNGAGDTNTALLAMAGVTRTLVADVTVRAQGGGVDNIAIFLSGCGVGVTLQQVTALAENASTGNVGLYNDNGATATLRGGSFTGLAGSYALGIVNNGITATLKTENITALGEDGSNNNYGLRTLGAATLRGGSFIGRGGEKTYGIENYGSSATLEVESVIALGENGSNENSSLYNYGGAEATLRGGSFTGRGGAYAYGIYSDDSDTILETKSVTVLAEDGSFANVGLHNLSGAAATLHGGSFTGRAGSYALGIANNGITTTLEAESITSVGENGSGGSFGLHNYEGASATLSGGSFTGYEGEEAIGIWNEGISTTLETESVSALGEDGSNNNYGLKNRYGSVAVLRGGSSTGRGGTSAHGIWNEGISTTLEAESVNALGENGSNYNYGLKNETDAAAALRGGSFTGHGGIYTYGINNNGSSTTLEAKSVAVLGENASSENYGLYNDNNAAVTADSSQFTGDSARGLQLSSGTVRLGVSQLDGSATRTGGTLTCFQVYDGSYAAYACP